MSRRLSIMLTVPVLLLFAIVVLAASAAYADSSDLALVGSQWADYEFATLPSGSLNYYPAAHGITVSIPDANNGAPGYLVYMVDNYTTLLTQDDEIDATIEVDSSSDALFMGNPNGKCASDSTSGNCPGSVRLFIQSNLEAGNIPNCVGPGYNPDNYWWSNPSAYYFPPNAISGGVNTEVQLHVPLSAGNWSNLCGQENTATETGFRDAIAKIKYVGLAFGSGNKFANGVGVDGDTGTPTFKLLSYVIKGL